MSDAFEFLTAILGAAAIVVASIVGSVTAYNLLVDKPACAEYSVVSGQETFYSLGTGCIVKRNGEWVDYGVAVGNKQEITLKQK